MRGSTTSSAKIAAPVTAANELTFGVDLPTTENPSGLPGGVAGAAISMLDTLESAVNPAASMSGFVAVDTWRRSRSDMTGLRHPPVRKRNSLDDLRVSGAAAQIAGERFGDFGLGQRLAVRAVEQRGCAHQETGRAVAALRRSA